MIKEKTENHCVLRNDTYSHSFESISELVEEAKRDFTTLVDADINVVKYGGRYYANTYGIEFKIIDKKSSSLSAYGDIHKLELVA